MAKKVTTPVPLLARCYNRAGKVTPEVSAMLDHVDISLEEDLNKLTEKEVLERITVTILLFDKERNAAWLQAAFAACEHILTSRRRFSEDTERRSLNYLGSLFQVAIKLGLEIRTTLTPRQVVQRLRYWLRTSWGPGPYTVSAETLAKTAEKLNSRLQGGYP